MISTVAQHPAVVNIAADPRASPGCASGINLPPVDASSLLAGHIRPVRKVSGMLCGARPAWRPVSRIAVDRFRIDAAQHPHVSAARRAGPGRHVLPGSYLVAPPKAGPDAAAPGLAGGPKLAAATGGGINAVMGLDDP